MQPECGGVHLLFRHGKVARAHVFAGVKLDLFEADNLPVDPNVAMHLRY